MPPEPSSDRPRLPQRLRTRIGASWKKIDGRRSSWGLLAFGAVLGSAGLWPLAGALWNLLGLTRSQAFHTAVLGAGVVLAAAGWTGLNRNRTAPIRLIWLITAAWAVAIGAVALMSALAWLVLGAPAWDPPTALTPKALDAIATRAFAIVAGLGAVALLVIHYRRQRTTERGEDREQTRLFTERFDLASEKLGSEHAAVRLAGVHALAHLADDALQGREELVQMVIDVLCAYLRMPYELPPSDLPDGTDADTADRHRARTLESAGLREVRHTIIRIIGDHLRADTHWRAKDYDFTGVVFDGGDLRGAVFSGGEVNFGGAEFSGSQVYFGGAEFSGSQVYFDRAQFSGGEMHFGDAKFSGGRVYLRSAVGTRPEGLLEAIAEAEKPEVVKLPEAWQPARGETARAAAPSTSDVEVSSDVVPRDRQE